MSVCTVVIRFGTYGYIIFIGPCVNADIIVDEREISVFFWKNGCAYVVLGYFHRTVCAAQCNQSTDVILKEADRSGIYAEELRLILLRLAFAILNFMFGFLFSIIRFTSSS